MMATLVDHMGDDLRVSNAARVSMKKHHDEFLPEDAKLISYLNRNNHFSPFTHCIATFYIRAPIPVARQLFRHQVGLTVNEVSRRYVDDAPEFYEINNWRKRAPSVKQGSSKELIDNPERAVEIYHRSLKVAHATYDELLNLGGCPEQARFVLPQAMYTEWYWTGSMSAFARICNLRLDTHAQSETADIAKQIDEALLNVWPVSWRALSSGRLAD